MIDAQKWKTIEKIFNKSVVLPLHAQKEYVASQCGDDQDLLTEVLTLLDEAAKEESFLSAPLFEVGAEILASEMIGLYDEPVVASYELLKVLGRGGSGVVFLAKDTVLKRNVALKVLPASLTDNNQERIMRFQQEAKAASMITHPNIAQVYGFGKAENRYYLALEYVAGKTLRQLIKEDLIDIETVLKFAVQLTDGISAAHEKGILHRDIKPENIIVTDDGIVKILDFGLAKRFTQKKSVSADLNSIFETKAGTIIGTPAYMSPEQIRGHSVNFTTDIWSFGIVLYEMLTNERPFAGETSSDVQAQILLSEPEYPKFVKKNPGLYKVLRKCLQKENNLRYQDILTVGQELKILLDKMQQRARKKSSISKYLKKTVVSIFNKHSGDNIEK